MRHQRNTHPSDFETALLLHRSGRLQEAEAIYKKMPHYADALHLRGLIAQQLNNYEQAIDLIKKAINLKPDHAPYYFSIEIAYRALNRMDEVVAAYLKLLALLPNNAGVHEKLASALRDLGNLNDAIACYQSALALNPNFAEAHANLGVALKMQDRLDEAVASYKTAIDMKPDFAEVHSNLGNAFKEQGRLDDAMACYQKALALKPELAETHLNLGNLFREQGELNEALACYSTVLTLRPNFPQVHNGLGAIFKDQGELDKASASYRQALAIAPDYAEAYNNLGNVLKEQDETDEAVACFERALSLDPNFFEAHYNLGSMLQNQGRLDEAILCFQRALEIKPDLTEAHNNLGLIYSEQGLLDEAIKCFKKCIELTPNAAEGHFNLGHILRNQGQLREATHCYWSAVALKPATAEFHNGLGLAFADQGNMADAITCHETALMLSPKFAEAHYNLGRCFNAQGKFDEAIACYEKAIATAPDFVAAYSNMGLAYHGKGKLAEAIGCYKQALDLDPGASSTHSNLLFAMQFSTSCGPEEIITAHAAFAAQFEAPLKAHWPTHGNAREPHKRLKIGYVSADFRLHPVATFIEPVLAAHDESQFEIYCYYNHFQNDVVTQRLKALADHWIPCKHLSDDQLAAQIRADGIDILIDLAGHTADNRLLAFARKPAPVQMTYLGYPGTSGLTAMDYRITDGYSDPLGSDSYYSEQLWRLPDSLCVYRPAAGMPEVAPLPALANGYVTFGSFNNSNKIDERTIALWANILRALPSSRLLMATVPQGERKQWIAQQFEQAGVAHDRIDFHGNLPSHEFHSLLGQADIALDPLLVTGGTTTCESLWMGVPVIVLTGQCFIHRVGYSFLCSAGLSQYAAATQEDYVRIALETAADLPRLAQLRTGMRSRLSGSPLMDTQRFAKGLEHAYRDVWQTWCERIAAEG